MATIARPEEIGMTGTKGTVPSHRDLIVWQRRMDLCVEIDRLAERLPIVAGCRLIDRMARASAAVPANIAEGSARGGAREYARFSASRKAR
jgi:hypothetical protein